MLNTVSYQFHKAVDLSHILENGMKYYPNRTHVPPSFELEYSTLAKDGVNVTRITVGSHTGTHIDAPSHFLKGAQTLDAIEIPAFLGEALVLDFSNKPIGSGITAEDLAAASAGRLREGDIVLCYTGANELGQVPYVHITLEGTKYLTAARIKAFGMDTLSPEKFPAHLSNREVHKEFLSRNIYIIEELKASALKQFANKRIFFVCLPLRIKGADGSPVRAIAIPIE